MQADGSQNHMRKIEKADHLTLTDPCGLYASGNAFHWTLFVRILKEFHDFGQTAGQNVTKLIQCICADILIPSQTPQCICADAVMLLQLVVCDILLSHRFP